MSDLNQIHAALQRPSLIDGQYRDCYGSAFGHRLSPGRQSKEFWTWGLLHKKNRRFCSKPGFNFDTDHGQFNP